ncbi:hypothetical protein QKW52_12860 [Bacillus sonorensis]|nr:hypothetical protein [Bacillus sonorensis]
MSLPKRSHLIVAARSHDKLEKLAVELETAHNIKAVPIPIDLSAGDAPGKLEEEVKRRGPAG